MESTGWGAFSSAWISFGVKGGGPVPKTFILQGLSRFYTNENDYLLLICHLLVNSPSPHRSFWKDFLKC